MLCGCGGGFDFLHSMTLYPVLRSWGKEVVIGSYSFGDPGRIGGVAPVVFDREGATVRRVTAESVPDPTYGPEVHLCSFLDDEYPDDAPHFVYAYYARAFTVPLLHELYSALVREHAVDAVAVFDGGSDSLMAGDEEGLGDPIEDAVTVATVAALAEPRVKILISIGLGADRFNQVSDGSSLRAVAELTARGGFLGALSLEPESTGFQFYKRAVEHIYERQRFRSALTGFIVSAARGFYGGDRVPPLLEHRVERGRFFVWPLMAMLWAFDADAVAERSLIVDWIRDCRSVYECYAALSRGRESLGDRLRAVEELPNHRELRASSRFLK